jgi:hypothetical protein
MCKFNLHLVVCRLVHRRPGGQLRTAQSTGWRTSSSGPSPL